MQKNYSDINMLLIRSHQFAIQDASRHSRKYNGKVFLAYVAERDGLGLTGKATNAPTLSNAAERVLHPPQVDGSRNIRSNPRRTRRNDRRRQRVTEGEGFFITPHFQMQGGAHST
jgi:hypothetical protein